ncbi:ADF-H/Gelsolin-like domain [Phytophthora cactorum]|nr:ADF-H/Gelsolin-like domain [Phytophthora cactorum]
MLYASSKEAIKRVLMGVGIHLTATDASELSLESIEDGLPSVFASVVAGDDTVVYSRSHCYVLQPRYTALPHNVTTQTAGRLYR